MGTPGCQCYRSTHTKKYPHDHFEILQRVSITTSQPDGGGFLLEKDIDMCEDECISGSAADDVEAVRGPPV